MNAVEPKVEFWPANRFYWALLDAPGLTRPGPVIPALLEELQEHTPVPLVSLHAVLMPVGDGRAVVCAAPRELLVGIDTQTDRLHPAQAPEFITRTASVEVSQLNMLTGPFEPRASRRRRLMRGVAVAASLLLVTGLTITGLLRRAIHWTAEAQDARDQTALLLKGVSPRATAPWLTSEVARLRAATAAAANLPPPTDASLALTELLRSWPASVSSKPQSIHVTDAGISTSVLLETEPAPFLAAFKAPAGWNLDEPRLNTTDKLTRVMLQLRPAGGRP